MTVRSGAQYLEGLRDGRSVWYGGERVSDVTTHAAFAARAQTIAQLYDLQQEPQYRDRLTFASPKTGEPVGLSFLMPRRLEDLVQRRALSEAWAELSAGMLGQSPDYMNIGVMSLAASHEFFARAEPRFGIHILRYYETCRETDRCLVSAVPDSGAGLLAAFGVSNHAEMHLQVVSQQANGLVLQGLCRPAALAPFADDIVLCGGAPLQPGQGAHALVCAIPVATPGLTVVCREAMAHWRNPFDHPLAMRFEEMDCVLLFEEVLVPWERVFLHARVDLYNRLMAATRFTAQVGHQVVSRQIAKTLLVLGVAHLLSEALGRSGSVQVQEKLGEIVTYLETLRACLRRAEVDAVSHGGVLYPQGDAIQAALCLFSTFYPRMIDILQYLGAEAYRVTPSESDMQGPMAQIMARSDQGTALPATERIRLFRLAWELVGDSFGVRQQLDERYFSGDPVSLMAGRYRSYDKAPAVERVQTLLKTSERAS